MNSSLWIVRIGAGILGLIGIISGGRAVYQGAAGFLGEGQAILLDPNVLALMDNEFRFFAGVWMLVGLALIVGAIFIEKKPDLIQIGLEAVFVGGLARLFAFSEYGPLPEVFGVIGVELVVPVALLILLKRATRSRAAVPAE